MEWINVKEKLPDIECQKYEVLVAHKQQIDKKRDEEDIIVSFATAKYYGNNSWSIFWFDSSYPVSMEITDLTITHWREIGNMPAGYNYLG